jgi:L-asparaginase
MKKLLFVFTGGTIGSGVNGEYIAPDSDKPYMLLEGYEKRFENIGEYDKLCPYTILSENINGEYIGKLISTVKNNLRDYKGIIITHGTDTLSYTASALGYALGNCDVPVCIVSANHPLENDASNGYWNLHGAIQFIKTVGKGGVWVSYKNDNDFVKIHRGCRIYSQPCFSHNVSSVKDLFYGYFDSDFNFIKNIEFSEKEDEIAPINPLLEKQCKSVLRIEPYPSMLYPEIPVGVKYILMGSYHSGTIDTMSESSKAFFDKAKAAGIKIFLTGVDCGVQYESTSLFSSLGIIPLPSVSPVSAFVKLWFLACENGRNIDEEMFLSLGGDII